MPDSTAIDQALIAKLGADVTLLSYMPNGPHWEESPSGSTKFVIVSMVDSVDEAVFGGRAIESVLYMVKAVGRSDKNPDMVAAAARIDASREDQPLTVTGYSWMTVHREGRIRTTEVDDVNPDIRWQHRGGFYRVEMSLT